ncbi:MAG: HEPN domain-containing protein [Acidobacteriota bacterium]
MPSEITLIDTLFREQKELAGFLQGQGQVSFSQNVEAFLSKTLLLSIASYFESRITNTITDYAARVSNADEALTSLVRIKAIERQYFTYFQWREGNRSVMPFFAMFGTLLRDSAKLELKEPELARAVAAFLQLGDIRNLLVHENFASYPLEMTSDEVYGLYVEALKFVSYIEAKLNPTPVVAALSEA